MAIFTAFVSMDLLFNYQFLTKDYFYIANVEYTGPAQPVRLVRFWPDQYLEVTSKIYFGLLR